MRRRAAAGGAEPETPKRRGRTVSESLNLPTSVDIDRPLPNGEILTDVAQKQWKIGDPIGHGSFGEIYLASDDIEAPVTPENSRYVVKIEPHSNGSLFVEIHCLIRSARHDKIKKWKKDKKLMGLGMPHYISNGSHLLEDTRYRFLVLPRYDCDVEKILSASCTRRLNSRNVLTMASQIIDVLEYLHANGYTHSDIKSSNLMVGFDGSSLEDRRRTVAATESEESKKIVNKTPKQKTKYGSYYYDEDFVLHNYLSSTSNTDYETDENSDYESRPSKIRKVSKKSNGKTQVNFKNAPMKRLFNLRKLKSEINYEDFNSSICSYDSYQELLDTSKTPENGRAASEESSEFEVDHFHEAIESQLAGQIYLLDFGLASKFLNSDGSHKEFEMDQRKAHDGTLEYSSRDSHIGAHSRRSDLENLGYNLIDWLTGGLPWKTPETLADPELVQALKKNYMLDVKKFLELCFQSENYPKYLEKYFAYINKLEFNEKPDYRYCKDLFVDEFTAKGYGSEKEMSLRFDLEKPKVSKKKVNYSKKCGKNPSKNTPPDFLKRNAIMKVFGRENSHMNSWENDVKLDLIREGLSNEGVRKPCVSRNFYVSDADLISKLRQTLLINHETPSKKFSPKNLRSTKVVKKKKGKNSKSGIGKFGNFMGSDKQYTWAEILAGNPESIIRKEKNSAVNDSTCDNAKSNNKKLNRKASNASEISVHNLETNSSPNLLKSDYLSSLNPTYAMKEVVANYKRKIAGKPLLKMKIPDELGDLEGYTPSMIKVIQIMDKNKKKETVSEERTTRNCKVKKEIPAVKNDEKKNTKKQTAKKTKNNQNIVEKQASKQKVIKKAAHAPLKEVQIKVVKHLDTQLVNSPKPIRKLRKRNAVNYDAVKVIDTCEKIETQNKVKISDKTPPKKKISTRGSTKKPPSKKTECYESDKSNEVTHIRTRSQGKVK